MPAVFEETPSCQLFTYGGTTAAEATEPTGVFMLNVHGTQVSTYTGERMSLLAELRDLFRKARTVNWDGEDGAAVSPVAYEWARKFLTSVPLHIPAPELSIDPDGHVNFDWAAGQNRVAAAIDERGLVYFISFVGGNRVRGMIRDFSRTFPGRLLDELRPLLAK
jgi:hypothetical protein